MNKIVQSKMHFSNTFVTKRIELKGSHIILKSTMKQNFFIFQILLVTIMSKIIEFFLINWVGN